MSENCTSEDEFIVTMRLTDGSPLYIPCDRTTFLHLQQGIVYGLKILSVWLIIIAYFKCNYVLYNSFSTDEEAKKRFYEEN